MRVAAALLMVVFLGGCAGGDTFHERLYAFAHAGQGVAFDIDYLTGPVQSPSECKGAIGRRYSADEQRRIKELCVRPQVASTDSLPKGVTRPVITLATK